MAKYQIDQIDQKILSLLVNNARMPFLEIAKECGISGAAIHQRVKKLEANGVDTTSLLANHINHPVPEMHDIFVEELLRAMMS